MVERALVKNVVSLRARSHGSSTSATGQSTLRTSTEMPSGYSALRSFLSCVVLSDAVYQAALQVFG